MSNNPDPVVGPSCDPLVDPQGDTAFQPNPADRAAPQLPRTPVKGSTIGVSGEPAPASSRPQKDWSPRRAVLTRQKRVAPTLKVIQSSPIDTFSPVASSTPAKPPPGKVIDESPLLGKRRRDEMDASPTKSTKPKSKGKAVDLAPEHTSPIESPRFDASTPGRTSKRPRESGESPGPAPKKKALRTGVLPTSPINSAVFPPNTELPPIFGRQGSVTISSDQLHKKPRGDRVIMMKSGMLPPAEVSVADTSVIESFDTSPPKQPTSARQAGSVENEKKLQVPVQIAAPETNFLTSPGTAPPEKQPTILPPPPPPKAARRTLAKKVISEPTVATLTLPDTPRENLVSNSSNVAEPRNPPLPRQTAKTIGITKLRPAATTIIPSEAGPSKGAPSAMPLRSRSTLGRVQKKNPIIPTKKGKEKPARMTPVEYAEMLIEKFNNPNRRIPNVSQHLRGRKIFYVGVDMRYAGDATKKKMEYVRTFDAPNLTPAAHSPVPDSQIRGHTNPQI